MGGEEQILQDRSKRDIISPLYQSSYTPGIIYSELHFHLSLVYQVLAIQIPFPLV